MKFSEVVSDAKAKGYTEPDPRDDLNGTDVARKVGTKYEIGHNITSRRATVLCSCCITD